MTAVRRWRRGRRDWLVDLGLFLAAATYGLWTAALYRQDPTMPGWLSATDQLLGVAGCAVLWWRRSWPTPIAVGLVVTATVAETAAGAMVAALFSLAVRRPPRVAVAVLLLSLLSAAVSVGWRPEPPEGRPLVLLLGVAVHSAATAWGITVRQRRSLFQSLRTRAEQAEAEAELLAERARRSSRDEIAREIHDVLGHRLSLLSLHAGALEYRADATPEETRQAVGVIRSSAHQALQDLREVIGVLRAPEPDRPQPSFTDLPALVAESSAGGVDIRYHGEVVGAVPGSLGRTAYRIVREAVTNARKHAPGASVVVRASGRAEDGLTLDVVDSGGVAHSAVPGSGQGLLGLRERVRLAGGDLEHGPRPEGGWRLRAWLPWPT
ncbi:two-component sensor histidine kinase [Actinoalloteichus sp. AHMU CJ021]|uniref:histidine kinase n=1 Tax=Actinoalloteichus caeruleus DSM 43889 TaxID=1120930 RepID=A0ABT1JC58_ACTCY|nr:histidine kinase [Actinoalloteichus caeruleus]AUS80693.1 two-component sensor histidine kinase [Actinoalloteichus sp. AHMU CJ021]MCP2330082.1 Histidine kinase [Actinoalloteichus caeruleus DSM 43889]